MKNPFLILAAANGFLVVAIGAFGAHGLEQRVSSDMMAVYETGVVYHMFHVVALLAVGILAIVRPSTKWLVPSGWCFLAGVILFSGSLYLMALTGIRALGMVTPIGGVAFLAGWGLLCLGISGSADG